jgi:hypothetical protein
MPANPEVLKALCYAEDGTVKPRTECRSEIINHLILEDMVDVDEAEDLADATMADLGLWNAPEDAASTLLEESPGESL